jgi:uncharacterized membrane protein
VHREPTAAAVRRYESIDATLVARARPFPEYLDTGLVEIGRYADRDPRVSIALLHAVAAAIVRVGTDEEARRRALSDVAHDVAARARARAATERDVAAITEGLEAVRAARATDAVAAP